MELIEPQVRAIGWRGLMTALSAQKPRTARTSVARGGARRAARKVDVFLCHNSKDKPAVTRLAERLTREGIVVWFDQWHLIPGKPWQEELETVIGLTRTALVLVGRDGKGPWEDREIRSLLSEFVRRGISIIPVFLPGAATTPDLPLFLREFTWVDLRGGLRRENIDRLTWGITGRWPGPSRAP